MNDHPIMPPPELVQDWLIDGTGKPSLLNYLAAQAAQWGANQELEACCEWLHWQNLATHSKLIPSLRAARRPKPPSLKEQALALVSNDGLKPGEQLLSVHLDLDSIEIIRRALGALPDA